MSSESTPRITVKAANQDNELEIRSLIDLFERTYQDRFPIKGVYDPRFWSSHINRRFISLLAYQDNQLCGHIAFQPERANPRQVQITLPVADFTYLRQNSRFASDVRSIVEELAIRQRWQSLYFFVFCSIPAMERQAHSMFGLTTTAFLPSYLSPELSPCLQDEQERSSCSIQLACRQFPLEQQAPAVLYVPTQYQPTITSLYAHMGFERVFGDGSEDTLYPADARGVERQAFKKTSVEQFFVHPSLLSGDEFITNLSDAHQLQSQFVFVSMRDAQCPEFCTQLEALGFSFCGILPHIQGRESIAYYRSSNAQDSVASIRPRHAQAQSLKEAILSLDTAVSGTNPALQENSFTNRTNEYN